ncbi:MAG: hypothetical protein AAB343_03680 [Patescibacteria group bacterium]
MTHRLSRINVFLGIGIILFIAAWLGLVERRMHYANVVSQLEQHNKELTGTLTTQQQKFNTTVAKENRTLQQEGTLKAEDAPIFVYRGGGTGVALAGPSR